MTRKNRTRLPVIICTVLLLVSILTATFAAVLSGAAGGSLGESPFINLYDGDLKINSSQFYDGTVIYKLPSGVKSTDELSLIIQIGGDSLLDVYDGLATTESFSEFYKTDEARELRDATAKKITKQIGKLEDSGIEYATGVSYSTLFNGFELIVKAGDFLDVCKTLGDGVNVIVGEVYKTEETKLVENKVNAFETGIFDTTGFDYDGTGMVVAVLDTGTDYYHSAFSMDNFTANADKWGLTKEEIAEYLSEKSFAAEGFQGDLSANDVYISGKLPYGYDYADKDSDVFPINSHHGTHVAGIIAGKDDTITGVAPNAQIVTMKIFSDTEQSARTSWILAALEDCVNLEVDVINMSIGTACGFSRETDKEQISGVYDRIRAQGINMVVAASNSFNSAYSSEKNGNLPLTSNPDSATVGSPSTYDGAMSVASIEGAKTSYILFGETIIYFEESTNRVSEEREFVNGLLGSGANEKEIEYVIIPGAGLEADYIGLDVKGKVALIKRGSNTFEEKANAAEKMGAAAAIIYNNVSGDIKMNVGETKIPVCSISQDDGELLVAGGNGTIKLSKSQAAGPFMSDFSSWGPTPDLGIKPEITAHGGSILSAVPGQAYDRISGTSMATPNITGVTALLRQYVVNKFFGGRSNDQLTADEKIEIAAMINRLMMSTADIVYNKNGNPYAVRKQGAGLANLVNCANTTAYILTYDRYDKSVMDKSKIELGDDPSKSGVYTLVFTIDNFGTSSLSYDVSALVMAEGISETKTNQGETTVTETAYMLGATVAVSKVEGGSQDGNKVSVAAGKKATVTVTVTLTDADKQYLNDGFENGTYVEGFVVLDAPEGTVDLSVPYLAFYGDWTRAPIFDLDYYATNKDELDDGIDLFDKTLADAYPTRPIGATYDDYVSYLGSYYYEQAPGSNKIAADRKYISLTNQSEGVNELKYVWAGLLRNVDYVEVTIVEDSTGEVVFETVDRDIRKSYGDGGPIRPANIDVGFSAIEENLKNNTKYTVTLKAYMDYGDGGAASNLNNTFTFPLTVDFEAPNLTGCEFYTEYDRTEKKNRLFAKIAVYDNHYAMAMFPGYIGYTEGEDGMEAMFYNFDRYLTPINSEENSTTYVIYELTDYIDDIKKDPKNYATGSVNPNTFALTIYDYALNISTYEIALPDEYIDLYFEETDIVLSPNEIYDLNPIVYPGTEWGELVQYSVARQSGKSPVNVVNNKIVAASPGEAQITATFGEHTTTLNVKVLAPPVYDQETGELISGDENYREIDRKAAETFILTGYYVDKAYYFLSTEERDIGEAGNIMKFFRENYSLKMFPSEKITLQWELDAYYPDITEIFFESGNPDVVSVDQNGTIEIVGTEEGYASVTATLMLDGEATYYSKTINIEIKDPWITSGPSLSHYYGTGEDGYVFIPDLGITEIGQYAFSNFDYIPKGEGDEISDEMPEATKISYIGDDVITRVKIPEGVETIGSFAFANLTKLEVVELPSTLTTIDYGAFYGCYNLKTVKGIENVKFINRSAFQGCAISGSLNLKSAIAIGDFAFADAVRQEFNNATGMYDNVPSRNTFTTLTLSEDCKSIGAYAFSSNHSLATLNVKSDYLKLGRYAFSDCIALKAASLNAAVIPAGTFYGCRELETVTIGKDVAQIGEYAFGSTKVSRFNVASGNTSFTAGEGGKYLLDSTGKTLMLAVPTLTSFNNGTVTAIAAGAFSGNRSITSVVAAGVTSVGAYAFADCRALATITLGALTEIGDYAFANTGISTMPDISGVSAIGAYAFAETKITSVVIGNGVTVGDGAFDSCRFLSTILIGDNVTIGKQAFRSAVRYDKYIKGSDGLYRYDLESQSPIKSLTIGKNATIGEGAFWFATALESITLGEGAKIGDHAFYSAASLKSVIGLDKATEIGKYAFSGDVYYTFTGEINKSIAYDDFGNYIYSYYSPKLTVIDISGCTKLGEDAFGYCRSLASVTLGDALTVIPAGAFRDCEKLSAINLGKVAEIGDYAFTKVNIASADLSSLESLGQYAFCEAPNLASVTFTDKISALGEGAFSYCKKLSAVTGLKNVSYVGDYSFAYTALTEADLSGATYIGTHAFMKESLTDFDVKLGKSLADIGDNPFVLCRLDRFSTTVTESFNGKDYVSTVYDFDLSDTILVKGGSLYRAVPNGLELICHCDDPESSTVRVADGTVRIGAYAFADSEVINVILPYTVRAIGHKAFYGCDGLMIVNFSSYYSPILEEEYDFYYFYDGQSLPTHEKYDDLLTDPEQRPGMTFHGLGIVDFFVWNVNTSPTNIFYGANFKDYIGRVENKAVMVKPTNGIGYDSFILSNYFGVVMEGASAADDTTLAAIAAINRIPEKVTLADKPIVEEARALYDKIATYEQRALVTEYQRLLDAERRISDLEYLQNQGTPEAPVPEPAKLPGWAIALIVVGSVLVAGGIGVGVFFLVKYLKKKKALKPIEPTDGPDGGIDSGAEAQNAEAETVTEAADEAAPEAEAEAAPEAEAENTAEEAAEAAPEAAAESEDGTVPAAIEEGLPPDVPELENEPESTENNEISEEKSEDKED